MDGQRLVLVRLTSIDAPETAQRPYGPAVRQRLLQLAPISSSVTLRVETTDRYGRTVAEVFRGGQSVNLAMVRDGSASAYRQYLARCDQGAFLAAEAAAQQQRLGVWSEPGGIQRPWDWRHGARRAAGTAPAQTASPSARPQTSSQRLTCKQIGSFATAQQLLQQGHSYLDRDGDGVACESLR